MIASSSGEHHWYTVNHHRPTFCNYCRGKLSGVPWHGLGCEGLPFQNFKYFKFYQNIILLNVFVFFKEKRIYKNVSQFMEYSLINE